MRAAKRDRERWRKREKKSLRDKEKEETKRHADGQRKLNDDS